MKFLNKTRAFTLVEIIFVVLILTIFLVMGTISFRNAQNKKSLDVTAQAIVSKLEEAKTNSVTGKGGQRYGVKFNSDSYVYFIGSSYISTNDSNVSFSIPNNLEISNTIEGNNGVVVFSKITGDADNSGTITIFEKDDTNSKIEIVVGELGDISVIK